MPKDTLRLIALCRVSTKDQKQNTSLGTQERDIKDYARIHGHKIVKVIADDESGYKLDQRKNLRAALRELHMGNADGIIVWKIDRYSRNVLQALAIFQALEKHQWHLIAVKDNIDTASPMGKAFFQLALVFAELQRNDIVWRTQIAIEAKRAKGLYAGGRPPYGWDAEGHNLVENAHEQAIIRAVQEMHRQGKSYRWIANHLNEQKIKTKTGKVWSHELVHRLIKPTGVLKRGDLTRSFFHAKDAEIVLGIADEK